MNKNKIIVFGVGTDFYSQVMRLKKEYDIICICDNNTNLHKKKVLGFRVITPATIAEYQFDFIKICSLAHTTAIRNQILNLGIPESKILPTPLWCTANSQNWVRLKNETKKNRVFIVGNGPSLNIDDLSSLHESKEQSFAFNKIYLAFDHTDYRPSFYMVEDLLVIQNIKEKINSLSDFPKFMPEFATRHLVFSPNDFIYGLNSPLYENLQAVQPTINYKMFGWGGSVTCSAIQSALFMGYQEIILLGIDNSFMFLPNENSNKPLIGNGERNHFHPDYRPVGETWTFPPSKITNDHFIMLEKLSKKTGSKIINCTRGGKVEVFERKSLEEVLN